MYAGRKELVSLMDVHEFEELELAWLSCRRLWELSECFNHMPLASDKHRLLKRFWTDIWKQVNWLCLSEYLDYFTSQSLWRIKINPLNFELNPICHLLALLGAHHVLHVSRIRFKGSVLPVWVILFRCLGSVSICVWIFRLIQSISKYCLVLPSCVTGLW